MIHHSGPAWRLAVRRIAAWSVDWLVIVGYAAALVPLGLLLNDRSVQLSSLAWNLISFGLLIVPVTVWLAGYLASLFVGSGRTPYDRVTGTSVRMRRGQ